jgi:hypothetical protein
MSDPDQPATAPAGTPDPASSRSSLRRDVLPLAACAAAAVVLIGSLGPWAQTGEFTAYGIERDGVLTFGAAVVAAAAVLVAVAGGTRPAFFSDVIAAVAAGFAAVIAVYDSFDIPHTYDLLADEKGVRTAEWGIWVTTIGSIILFAVTVAVVARARWRRTS